MADALLLGELNESVRAHDQRLNKAEQAIQEGQRDFAIYLATGRAETCLADDKVKMLSLQIDKKFAESKQQNTANIIMNAVILLASCVGALKLIGVF